MNDALLLTHDELVELTGFRQPARQLVELHRRGFVRAWRASTSGQVILERVHYEAVSTGTWSVAPASRPPLGPQPAWRKAA